MKIYQIAFLTLLAFSNTTIAWSDGPAGSNEQVQYNNSGSFGADASFTFTTTTQTVSAGTLSTSGNILIGGTQTSSNASNILVVENGTVPTTSPSNAVQLYAQDLGPAALAAQFTAANSEYLSITNAASPDLDFSGANPVWYASGWLNADSLVSNPVVFSKITNNSVDAGAQYRLRYNTSANRFDLMKFYGATDVATATANNYGAWSTATKVFVEVYDTGTSVGICVNRGTDNTTANSSNYRSSTADFRFGTIFSSGSPINHFDGRMQNWMFILGAVPTSTERDAFYNSGNGINVADRPSLSAGSYVHWWQFNEVSGNRADSIGSYTLTDNNSVTSGTPIVNTGLDYSELKVRNEIGDIETLSNTPAGVDGQIQYNGNNSFAANSSFTFTPSTQIVTAGTLSTLGNLLVGNTSPNSTVSNVIVIENGTAPTASPQHAVQLYAQDVGDVALAAQFTAANSEYLSITNAASPDLDFSGANPVWYASGWLNADSLVSNPVIFSKLANNAVDAGAQYRLRYHTSSNRFELMKFYGTTDVATVLANNYGAWSTATKAFVEVYSTGTSIGICVNRGTDDTTANSSNYRSSTSDFRFGTIFSAGSPINNFDGRMQNWMFILGAVPNSTERDAFYNSGNGINVADRPTLSAGSYIHWWQFNEVSGNRADSIGSYTLTDNNSVTSGTPIVNTGTNVSELKVRDEEGNITVLSPHNTQLIPREALAGQSTTWTHYEENAHTGRKFSVNMEKMARLVEKLSGEQIIYEQEDKTKKQD